MSNSGSSAGSASRLAAARLERSQIRAEAARKTPTTSSNSSYGNFWDPNSAQAPAGAPSSPNQISNVPGQSATPPAVAGAAGVTLAEIGVPIVPLSSSEAFGVCSKEGALHENHDRGAAAILPDRSTVLFACLDGHGAEGASVSGYALRNLLAGCASALQVRVKLRRCPQSPLSHTAHTHAHMHGYCRALLSHKRPNAIFPRVLSSLRRLARLRPTQSTSASLGRRARWRRT